MASTEMRVPTLAICNKAEAVENVMMTRKIIDGVTCGRSSLPSAWGSNSNVIIQVIVMVIREISQMWRLTVAKNERLFDKGRNAAPCDDGS